MQPHPPADWLEFWVRFVFGAALGAFVGVFILQDVVSGHAGMLVAACVVVFGMVAGWFGDRFWYSFKHWL